MIRPDFRQFKQQRYQAILAHSAKGSEWDKHKYVKKIDGVYYYPVGYEDGRTVDELSGSKADKKTEEKKDSGSSKKEEIDQVKHHFDEYLKNRGIDWTKLPKDEVDQMQRDIVKQLEKGESGANSKSTEELVKEVISGKHGNGEDRKKALGNKYEEVQKEVNKKLKSSSSGEKRESVEKEDDKKKKKAALSGPSKGGVNLDKVFKVYKKREYY